MALSPGTRLGPYEIIAPLGAGGMGEVYRAKDTRLGREVAVKVLPPAYAQDPDRLRRFEQEARAAGSLNHPNILTIHDVGTHEGSLYVVSELLEGETLRDRLGRGPLPARKVREFALQICSGLGAAHDKGIVHRDLKPENLFLTNDGRVKILDFGLAKLVQAEASAAGADTATNAALTAVGAVLGTAGYMAPEQVRGEPSDHRLDLFTFGAILYEMLTGRRAFQGGSAVESMSAILKDDPTDALEAVPGAPPALVRIVRRSLEKSPQKRFQSAHDLAFALEDVLAPSLTATTIATPVLARPRPRLMPAVVALVGLAALAGAYFAGSRSATAPSLSFQRLTYRHGAIVSARFAPEARTILFSAAWEAGPVELFSTRSESSESRSLGVPGAELLAVSSGGEMALLRRGGALLDWHYRLGVLAQVPLAGGAPRDILEGVRFADWAPDGAAMAVVRVVQGRFRIEFPIGKVLYETPDNIGGMRLSPKGDQVAFAERPPGFGANWSVAVVDRNGKKKVLSSGWPGAELLWLAWPPAGEEVWFASGISGGDTLRAVSLAGRVRTLARFPVSFQLLDVSRDGRVLANRVNWRGGFMGVAPGETTERDLSWLDASEIDDLSHDGKTLLITEYGEAGGSGRWSVYLRKTDGSPAVRLGDGQAFALSPDAKWVATLRRGSPPQLVLLPTGPGPPVVLENGSVRDYLAADWLPDGKRILFAGVEPGHGARCYLQDIVGGPPRPVAPEGVTIRLGQHSISPDGAGFAAMNSQGQVSLYPVEGGEPRPLLGLKPGDAPLRWSADERALFVLRKTGLPAKIFRVEVTTGRSELWKDILPSDPAGIIELYSLQLAADETSYYYSYIRTLSDLYLIEGLK
jgi:serine/threonine protein kinase